MKRHSQPPKSQERATLQKSKSLRWTASPLESGKGWTWQSCGRVIRDLRRQQPRQQQQAVGGFGSGGHWHCFCASSGGGSSGHLFLKKQLPPLSWFSVLWFSWVSQVPSVSPSRKYSPLSDQVEKEENIGCLWISTLQFIIKELHWMGSVPVLLHYSAFSSNKSA